MYALSTSFASVGMGREVHVHRAHSGRNARGIRLGCAIGLLAAIRMRSEGSPAGISSLKLNIKSTEYLSEDQTRTYIPPAN